MRKPEGWAIEIEIKSYNKSWNKTFKSAGMRYVGSLDRRHAKLIYDAVGIMLDGAWKK